MYSTRTNPLFNYLLFLGAASKTAIAAQPVAWQQLASMPTPRSELPATIIGVTIYTLGSIGGMDNVEPYDTTTNRRKKLAALPGARLFLPGERH